ncbi:hypothetical protein B0H19DRAFT_1085129 [Mycena capillaripes]|nr:hypothetical protein B0H19DRAFT_1085129 [Mycena capillaripes]
MAMRTNARSKYTGYTSSHISAPRLIHTGAAFERDREVGGSPGRDTRFQAVSETSVRIPSTSATFSHATSISGVATAPAHASMVIQTPLAFTNARPSPATAPATPASSNARPFPPAGFSNTRPSALSVFSSAVTCTTAAVQQHLELPASGLRLQPFSFRVVLGAN